MSQSFISLRRRVALIGAGFGTVAVLVVAVPPVSSPVSATPGVFDPTMGVFDEPILIRADGDTIPFDQAGLGGDMFDALPTDVLTAEEQAIVDDVITTGATLASCRQGLLDAGANQVDAITLA